MNFVGNIGEIDRNISAIIAFPKAYFASANVENCIMYTLAAFFA